MKERFKLSPWAVFASLLFLCGNAVAGTYSGRLQPYFWSGILYLAQVGGQRLDAPACSKRPLFRLEETDPNSIIAKEKYAMLLAVWLSGKTVTVTGTGVCTSEGDETIVHISPDP